MKEVTEFKIAVAECPEAPLLSVYYINHMYGTPHFLVFVDGDCAEQRFTTIESVVEFLQNYILRDSSVLSRIVSTFRAVEAIYNEQKEVEV